MRKEVWRKAWLPGGPSGSDMPRGLQKESLIGQCELRGPGAQRDCGGLRPTRGVTGICIGQRAPGRNPLQPSI